MWRWAWLILLGAAVLGGTTFLISRNTTPVYRAASRLLIDEAPGAGTGNEYSQVLLEQRLTLTYLEIMKTRPVLEATIERLSLPFSAGRLAGMVTVSAPQDTQIIIISVEDTNPERAAAIANAVGEVFIDQNQSREDLRYAEPIANWQERQAQVADEIEALEAQINSTGSPNTAEEQAALSRLETQLNEAQIRYTEAFNQLNELQISLAKESSNVIPIEPAQPVRSPIRPQIVMNTVLASVIGALLGVAIVILIEYLDDTLKTPEHVLQAADLTTLGAIAQIQGDSLTDRLIAARAPRAPISEAYRVLRTNLGFSSVDGGLGSLVITSSSPGEGKSTTAANLAVVLSQTGKRVMLVDADLRRPMLHKFFELKNNQGLTTAVLDSDMPTSHHVQSTSIPGLRILTSGPIPPNPAELLNSQRMTQVLAALRQEAELVIFDTPPALTVADATILATQVDGCLMIVEVGKTRTDTLIRAVERIRQANANIYGVVLNLLRPIRSGYYYYYDYYYSREYDQTARGSRRRRNRPTRLPAWLAGLGKR
jgi:non-specific protein-tyrosine kinase